MKIDWKKEIALPKLRKPSLPSRSPKAMTNASAPKPGRSKPKPRRPSLGGPDLQMPKFLTDLYADLRDRRLLPLVALLIVAIVAAPILLSGGDKEEAPAISPAGVEGETKEAGLTVVPAEDGLRNYKRRLGHRVALNPFRRPAEPESTEGEGSSSASGSEGGSESESGSEPTSASGDEVVKTTVGGVTTETIAPSGPEERHHNHQKSSQSESSGGESTEASESAESTPSEPAESSEPTKPTEPSHTEASTSESSSTAKEATAAGAVVGYTIDAEAGFVPNATEKTDIAPMTKLPNKKHPLVLYMGLSKNHKRALFLMTSNVTAYYGGHCALDKQACQLIEVAPGKGITFAAGYGNSRYKVHLKRIVPVVQRAH